jgi:hypothetical protein
MIYPPTAYPYGIKPQNVLFSEHINVMKQVLGEPTHANENLELYEWVKELSSADVFVIKNYPKSSTDPKSDKFDWSIEAQYKAISEKALNEIQKLIKTSTQNGI